MMINYYIAKLLRKLMNPKAIKNSDIHKSSKICYGCNIINTSIDRYSYVGDDTNILNTEIGAFSSIASNVNIGGSSHPICWVSTSPAFCKGTNVLRKNFFEHDFVSTSRTMIGNDVWIGNGAFIKAGVTIGDGAIIGMGAVVTKEVEPYAIVAGNPAKVIRYRFHKELISSLLESKWWTLDEERLLFYAKYFNKPEEFISQMQGSVNT